MCEKYYIWNPSTCICENSRYLKSIVDDSVILCHIYCIDKHDKYYISKCQCIVSDVLCQKILIIKNKIWNGLLYFAYVFISSHITF